MYCVCTTIYDSFVFPQITKREVLGNDDLFNAFRMFVRYHQTSQVEDNHIRILFKDILTRVVNTMSNKCMDLLDRVSTNKGVDAQMSL